MQPTESKQLPAVNSRQTLQGTDMDIKELATLTAAEMDDIYLRNVPAIVLEQYAARLIAAYLAEQEPVGKVLRNSAGQVWIIWKGETDMIDYVGQQLFTAAPEPAPSAWWASLMEAAAALEIAAMQIKDPDGKRQAQGACDFARSRAKQLWANSKPTACAAPSSEEVQWRNIKHVVRTLADWAFGGKDDPRWGTAWVAMVNGLTAKDGPTFNLERLAARVPYGCVVVGWLDGRGRFFYADDPMYKNNHKGMREVIAAGEVK